jgi:eukaryotic-like serine/threonine-protein kinase
VIGSTLGPYQVLAKLGEGGMGEVFRARDTRLNRDVAIKMLPEIFANDAERVARFTREAQTLAALNHPLIAQIYGVEVGAAEGGVSARRGLVMELVEGEDLSQRIARGPLPLDEALSIARQIAEALEAAHEQGIVHRDLKPGNIKLRPDGTVKVLDFGLAKALEPPSGASNSAPALQSPTITTPAMTLQGVIMGTAAYMSPEQAKGKAADQRSDVWAFGCVLFEMLTGRRAFEGEDVSDTLAAVLRGEPDYSALPADTPFAVRALIRRCFERDRRKRIASLSTARFVIDEASEFGAAANSRHQPDEAGVRTAIDAAVAAARRTLIRTRLLPAVAFLALIAMVFAVLALRSRPAESKPITRFSLSPRAAPGPANILGTLGRPVFALSNDGANIVYTASRRVFIRPLADFEEHPVAIADIGESFIHSLVFSPDDQAIAFFSSGGIQRVNVAGGTTTSICAPVQQPWGISWDASGILVGQGSNGILRCPPNGGAAEQPVTLQPGEVAQGPQMLPGGDALLFTLAKVSDGVSMWDKAEVVVQSLSSKQRTTIMHGGADARYVPTGHLVYAVGGVVFAAPFDLKRREIVGAAVPVIEGVRRAPGVTGHAHFVSANNGTLMYVPGPVDTMGASWAVAVADRTGATSRLSVPPGPYAHIRASRDGSQLAIGSDDGSEANVWIYRFDGSTAIRRLTLTGQNRFPVWLPDGQRAAFQSNRDGDAGIFVQRADGTGVAERLTKPAAGETHIPDAWSPDGRYMLFDVVKDDWTSLWIFSTDDRQAKPFGDVKSRENTGAVFSADARWVAYASTPVLGGVRSPNRGIFVQPFPTTGATYQLPAQMFDFHPAWSPKGLELVYVPSASGGEMSAVALKADSGIAFAAPTNFAATLTAQRTSGFVRAWDILPDGRLVGPLNAAGPDATGGSDELRVVINWFEELKKRAPLPR